MRFTQRLFIPMRFGVVAILLLAFVFFPLLIKAQGQDEAEQEPRLIVDTKGHQSVIKRIVFSPDGKSLYSTGLDKTIRVWDPETGDLKETIRKEIGNGFAGSLFALAISHDGRFLAMAGRDGEPGVNDEAAVRIIDLEKEAIVAVLSGHTNTITDVQFSPDSLMLASGGLDKTIRLWDLRPLSEEGDETPLRIGSSLPLQGHSGDVYSIRFAEREDQLLLLSSSASNEKNLLLWDLSEITTQLVSGADIASQSTVEPKNLAGHDYPVYAADISPDGKLAVSGDIGGNLLLWDLEKVERIRELDRIEGLAISAIAISPDSSQVMASSRTAGSQGKTAVYPILPPYGDAITEFEAHQSRVTAAAWDPATGMIATSEGGDNEIFLWKADHDGDFLRIDSKGEPVFNVCFASDRGSLEVAFGLSVPESGNPDEKHIDYLFDFANMRMKRLTQEDRETLETRFRKTQTEFEGKQLTRHSQFEVKVGDDSIINFDPEQRNRVLSYSFTEDGKVILGGDYRLSLYDQAGELERHLVGHEGPVWSVSTSVGTQYLVSGSHDRTIRLWNLETGDHLVSLFVADPEKDQWVCWTPEGYFSSSSEGANFIGWHFNKGQDELANFVSSEQLFEHYYRPDVIERTIQEGKKSSEIVKALQLEFDLKRAEETAPSIEFVNLDSNATAKTRLQNFSVKATDRGAGVAEVRVFHQGKLVEPAGPAVQQGDSYTIPYSVALINGDNQLRAVAVSPAPDKFESPPNELALAFDGEQATSNLHILAVGLNEYLNPSYNLTYCRADAEGVVERLQRNADGLFIDAPVTTVYDAEAIRPSIEAAFAEVAKNAKPEDVFIFFYAGHGAMESSLESEERQFHFILHDVRQIYGDPAALQESALSADQLREHCKRVEARKQLLILDACQAGGFVDTFAFRGVETEMAIAKLARSSGLLVLAATGRDKYSREVQDLGHGLFSYSIIRALEGDGDLDDDKEITVGELKTWLEDSLPDLSRDLTGVEQHPTGMILGNDFPIGIIR